MDILSSSALVLYIVVVFFTTSQAALELHYGQQELVGFEGGELTIVCETDIQYADESIDAMRGEIQWLRGKPVEYMEIVAQSDRRISIDTDITSNTGAEVIVRSNLTISGLVREDSNNYTCCKRDSFNCISWPTRSQRQLQVEIIPIPRAQVIDLEASTKPSLPMSTVETLFASTASTTLSDEYNDIPTLIPGGINDAFRQTRKVYTIALPCGIIFILTIVVITIARYHWRRKHVETPVQTFSTETV